MMRFLALLLAVAVLSAFAQDPARVVKPEIRVGDSWTYRSTNFFAPGTGVYETRVSFVSEKAILVISTNTSDGKEIDSSWTSEWNAVTAPSRFIFDPHSGIFSFPMSVGDTRKVKYELRRPRLNTVVSTATGTATVVGWEAVEVPAGKFRALKVQLDSMVQPSDNLRAYSRLLTFWYVPEVRRWVKFQVTTPVNSINEELLEYKLNEN